MDNPELEPSVEVAHLRRLLDIQPSCLLRLGADGTVLAANDAALALLGATSGAQALGRDFTAWVPSYQLEQWREFTVGVAQGDPASIECDITPAASDPRPTLFHAVPLLDHPDGVPSMAVSARAVAGQRQLEAAVAELEEQLHERNSELLRATERLGEVEASRVRLEETAAALEARLQEREAGPDEEGRLAQLSAELRARDEALAAADAARLAADANCSRALADVRQLEMALEAFAARQPQVTAAPSAGLQDGRQMLGSSDASHEQSPAMASQRERDVRAERDAIQSRLDQVLIICQEREAALGEMETSHAALAMAHRAAMAEHERFVSAVREHAVHLGALANGAPWGGGGPDAAERATDLRGGREEERA
ncbi:MAG: PAS domain-containing protein [Vicinamibacterales bacterium]|nr:PAS domain-containing protein [Vicinamibacterales bacterium]